MQKKIRNKGVLKWLSQKAYISVESVDMKV